MRVAFRCDAGRRVGAGHLMRCLTLADVLAAEGAKCLFFCRDIPDHLAARVQRQGHLLVNLPEAANESAEAAACRSVLGKQRCDWLVVDHYELGSAWESSMRPSTRRILAIDDLADRQHDCDILFDQTLGRDPAAYAPFLPPGCLSICGAREALLRPEFAAARPSSLPRRRSPHPLRRVFVNFGGGDCSELLLDALLAMDGLPGIEVRAVLGASRLPQDMPLSYPLQVFDFVDEVASHLCWADFAIGAPGSSSWERCCLGVPSVLVPFASNQKLVAANLASAGLAWVLERDELKLKLPALLYPLLADSTELPRISSASSTAVDGWGASRLASRMLERPLWLRPAEAGDCETLWRWANDPLIRQMSFSPEPIPWESHQSWFARELSRQGDSSFLWIAADLEGGELGQIRFNRLGEGVWCTDIHLAPGARGRGLGQPLLLAGLSRLRRAAVVTRVEAQVLHENQSSRRLFEACGFRLETDNEKTRSYILGGEQIP
ncbi:MAG: UDP-2,4-diacetamido-2,4, 6-trideoxy-beta-L-altropyranose hydrolase [Verrucomicrobiota bacterium]|jgi:UDP-2,4-diacetamido-2,4,6-trideoxy-beta-L-altropyranose hydrolase